MDEVPPIPEIPPPTPEPPVRTSVAAKLLNVFASPGEVFEEVKRSPTNASNWLVPMLLAIVIGVTTVMIMFSNPEVVQRLREKQAKVFEDKVKAGQMSQKDADRAIGVLEKFSGPIMMKITGSISVVGSPWCG